MLEALANSETKLLPVPPPITRNFVAGLVDQCKDTKGIVNDIFISILCRRIQQMNCERVVQALEPLSIEELLIMVHMAVLAATLHDGQERKSQTGTVFKEHLDDAVGQLAETTARTEAPVVAATYGHDIWEDTPIKTFEAFLNIWEETFKNSDDRLIAISRPIAKRIWDLIGAASKVKKQTRPETRDATLRKLLSALIRLGPDVLHLKFGGDRLSNLKTLNVHPEEKQKEIAGETYEVYCRLGEIFGMHEFVRIAVDSCATILNKKLLDDFHQLRDERIAERLERKKVKIRNASGFKEISVLEYIEMIFAAGAISGPPEGVFDGLYIKLVPKSLAKFVLKNDKPLDQLTIDDCGISSVASLFEIAVMVRPGTSTTAVRDYIMSKCWKAQERFEFIDRDPDQVPQQGAVLVIYSETLGTLRFRINDEVSEKRSRRGILPISEQSSGARVEGTRVPPRVHKAVNRILQESALEPESTLRLARELLLHPTIMVYTKDNKPVELPNGATIQDLAAAIHPDLLIALQGAVWHRPIADDPSETEAVPISIFDPLKPGMRIELIANTSLENRGAAPLEGDPGRLLYCRRATRTELRHKGFAKRGLEDSVQLHVSRGETYVARITKLFGLEKEDIVRDVRVALREKSHEAEEKEKRLAEQRKRRKPADGGSPQAKEGDAESPPERVVMEMFDDEIYERVGNGEIELLEILSKTRFSKKDAWKMRVELPHAPHTLEQFMAQLNKDVNADRILHIPRPPPHQQAIRIDLIDIGDVDGTRSSFEMMKMLLKLSYRYELALEHRKWRKRAGLKLMDTGRLLFDSLFRRGGKERTTQRSALIAA